MHVESDHNAFCDFAGAAVHQVLGQPGSKVTFPCSARPGQDESAVFEKETYVMLHHGFWDESFEHKAVDTLLFQT